MRSFGRKMCSNSLTKLYFAAITERNCHWAATHFPQFSGGFKAQSRQNSYLLGRALLATALSEHFDIEELPEMILGAHNKPIFKTLPIGFNITHSDEIIALAIAAPEKYLTDSFVQNNVYEKTPKIGIDLEIIRPRRNFAGLLKRTFTAEEIAWILSVDSDAADTASTGKAPPFAPLPTTLTFSEMRRFFALWSGKEAYLKADGSGLSGLSNLHLHPEKRGISGVLSGGSLHLIYLEPTKLATLMRAPNSAKTPINDSSTRNNGHDSKFSPHSLALYLPHKHGDYRHYLFDAGELTRQQDPLIAEPHTNIGTLILNDL